MTVSHRTAPHRTASQRIASHRSASHRRRATEDDDGWSDEEEKPQMDFRAQARAAAAAARCGRASWR